MGIIHAFIRVPIRSLRVNYQYGSALCGGQITNVIRDVGPPPFALPDLPSDDCPFGLQVVCGKAQLAEERRDKELFDITLVPKVGDRTEFVRSPGVLRFLTHRGRAG